MDRVADQSYWSEDETATLIDNKIAFDLENHPTAKQINWVKIHVGTNHSARLFQDKWDHLPKGALIADRKSVV